MGFEAMYNNSVAIAGCDKCQRGTGTKGPRRFSGSSLALGGTWKWQELLEEPQQGQAVPLCSPARRAERLPENRELPACLGCAPAAQRFLNSRGS